MLKPDEIVEASSVANFCIEKIMHAGNPLSPIRRYRSPEVIALITDLIVTAAESVRDIRAEEEQVVSVQAKVFKVDGNGNVQPADIAEAKEAVKQFWREQS